MSQSNLQNLILGIIVAFIVVTALFSSFFRNALFAGVLGLGLLLLPFLLDPFVRHRITPWLDSLNESSRSTEEFPLWLKILIWAFLGIVLAFAWSHLAPFVLGLPLWLGRIAVSIGWKSLAVTDGAWQFGWTLQFLVSYLLSFIVGWFMSDFDYLDDRFEYPTD